MKFTYLHLIKNFPGISNLRKYKCISDELFIKGNSNTVRVLNGHYIQSNQLRNDVNISHPALPIKI